MGAITASRCAAFRSSAAGPQPHVRVDVAVDVDPAARTALEPAGLVQRVRAARGARVRHELDLAGRVLRSSVARAEDLEPGPGDAERQGQVVGPGPRVPVRKTWSSMPRANAV